MKKLLEKATQIVEEKMLENPTIPEELREELIKEEYKKLRKEYLWNLALNGEKTIDQDERITPAGWFLNQFNNSDNNE